MRTSVKPGLLLLSLLLASASHAQVYRCEDDRGVRFSDQPCGDHAETVTIRDNRIGGRFNDNLPAPEPTPPVAADDPSLAAQEPQASDTPDSPCRFINSTDLRTYLIREQVVVGMTRDQVRQAFGPPPETYPVPQETWVYHTDYYDKLYELTYVYFRDGCVESVVYRKP
ncbi:DUF4124 domain-containing protein [Marinobacter zhejiangensis]|uniref:SmpA / OmlA family protein n=1 Tax=Marinobacter zhejiangensis TaxID=488535 RepID=A0A1I4L8P4_9GAMM|nr:DUF4124 domain-containing protein [Marinobacter zhejiangensis]SFL87163.1 SmpA / OmlA family protein [Marinobacter zhejiangensis]